MAVRVADILAEIEKIAPPELAEAYDNVGLLAGSLGAEVRVVLAALDLTEGVIDEALDGGAQLILTHHPILFGGRKTLSEDDPEGALIAKLIRARLSLIAAHTNFDNAEWGVSDALAGALALGDTLPLEKGLRIGSLAHPMPAHAFLDHVRGALGGAPRLFCADRGQDVLRVAVCGGAGGAFYDIAARAGANAYVTGEIQHHNALAAVASGLVAVQAGHFETEFMGLCALADCLQNRLDALQYNVRVLKSGTRPFDGV